MPVADNPFWFEKFNDVRENPLVSVVIPAYNAERWIKECIESVLMQDYPNIEIIVMNDASTDKTIDNVLEIMDTHPKMRIILGSNAKNEGECITSYNGFELAAGDFICRLSADDVFVTANHISEQVAEMEASGAEWCYNSRWISGQTLETSTDVKSFWLPVPTRYCKMAFQTFDNIILRHPFVALVISMRRNCVNSSTLMIRWNCYEDVKWCRDYRTDCDGMLIFRMFLKRKIGIAIPTVGVFYRTHPNQMSYTPRYMRDMAVVRDRIQKHVLDGNYPFWLKLCMSAKVFV